MAATTQPWLSSHTAKDVLNKTHYAYPLVLCLVFILTFIAQSVLLTAQIDDSKHLTSQTGPGGKPLPRNTSPAAKEKIKDKLIDFTPARKLFFVVTSVLVLLTFAGNAVIVTIHALTGREGKWWCGQAFVVRRALPRVFPQHQLLILPNQDLRRRYFLHLLTHLDFHHRR